MLTDSNFLKLQQANKLSDDIFLALKEGDSKLAEQLSNKRHALIQGIDFSALENIDNIRLKIEADKFNKNNQELIKTSEAIKNSIAEQLGQLRKSRSGSKTYQDIHKL